MPLLFSIQVLTCFLLWMFAGSTVHALTTCKDRANWCSGPTVNCDRPDDHTLKLCMLTCQYCTSGNVAYGKPTNQSSDYDIGYESINAVDGKRETGVDAKCTLTDDTDTDSWWCVDLMNSYHVSKMDIYTDDLEAGGFSVRLSEHGQCDQTTFESASVCYNDRHVESDNKYSLTSCNEMEAKFEGRLVFINTIEKQTSLDLCEVEIYSAYCSPGFYEIDDVCRPCNCGGNTCNPTTGACVISCSPNCINNRCDVAGNCLNGCHTGYYGNRCDLTCSSSCKDKTCDSSSGDCLECNGAFYGKRCDKNCTNCNNSVCNITNGVCLYGCKEGFHGSSGLCGLTCPNCKPGGCYMDSGICINGCIDGFYGPGGMCVLECPNCLPGGCAKTSGDCNNGCKDGFYGNNCESRCQACKSGRCKRKTGSCIDGCPKGFYGKTCQKNCSNCLGGLYECDKKGKCIHGCKEGFYGSGGKCGKECKRCLPGGCEEKTGACIKGCQVGFYGSRCTFMCNESCENGCSRESGDCLNCTRGFYGDFCKQACSTNCLNSICMKSGSSIRCTEGCINGKTREDCSDDCPPHCISCEQYDKYRCTACEEGWRGYDCYHRCSRIGTNCKTCHQTEYRCLSCKPGWYGEYCRDKCFDGCLNTVCDIDGSCSNCTSGYFGPRCEKTCPGGCLGGECNTDGTCHGCMTGLFGEYCEQTCPLQCLKGKCNLNGVCSDGCKDGRYGEKCEKICSTGCKVTDVHPRCEYRSGKCIDGCVAGKKGDNCSEDCDKNLYGKNCLQNCGFCFADEGCDGVTGECSSEGCQEGYTGIMCIEEVDGGSNYAAVGGGIVVLLVVILAAVMVGFVWRRGRQSKGDQISPETVPLKPPSASPDTVVTVSPPDAECDDSIYQNTGDNSLSPTAIPISNIWNAIAKKEDINEFTKEFKSLPIGLCCPHEIALSPENKAKNRYKMVCAFDHTRVKMDIINDDPNSDYINACYISGYRQVTPPYIAAQGPTPVNINDFWRMIWVVNSGKIVMLTNLVELGNVKCLQYWPEQGQVAKYGLISVKMLKEDQYARFTIRTLDVTRIGCGRRTIKQFHYTSWPDKSIPPDAVSLAEFTDKVDRCNSQCSGPLVVHCSAGIGRTGTFLAFNFLIEEAMDTGYVDVLGCVKRMRFERVNMVQTQDQYVFLHKMIALWKLLQKTSAPVTSFQPVLQSLLKSNSSTGKCGLQEKYDLMEKHRPIIEDSEFETALSEDNRKKNRDLSIVACETHRAYISNPASAEDSTDYINAVFLPSYSAKRGYVLTHSPLNNTVTDFWCLVVDTNIQTIVDFDSFSGNASVQYIPNKDTTLQMGSYLVKCLGQDTETENYILKTCQVQHIEEAEEITVKIYLCKVRFNDMVVPFSPLPLFHILGDIQNSGDRNPILVHCLDGVEKSGLFCTLGAIVDRLTKEQHVSVLQVIQQLRLVRPQIITNYQQFRFCFNAVGEYLDYFSDYANSA